MLKLFLTKVGGAYPKTYVVRPQFFLPIITLLRNAAMNSLKYKTELALVRAQNIDITNFETNLETFKTAFGRNYDLASASFKKAVEEIDKSIDQSLMVRNFTSIILSLFQKVEQMILETSARFAMHATWEEVIDIRNRGCFMGLGAQS